MSYFNLRFQLSIYFLVPDWVFRKMCMYTISGKHSTLFMRYTAGATLFVSPGRPDRVMTGAYAAVLIWGHDRMG
jgi:hypothetical protein